MCSVHIVKLSGKLESKQVYWQIRNEAIIGINITVQLLQIINTNAKTLILFSTSLNI